MDQNKTGKYIAEKRKLKNLTQAQLAEKLGVSDRAVSKWERGLSLPDVSKYQELCEILGISLNELFAGENLDETGFREHSDQNLIRAVKKESGLMKRYRAMKIVLIMILMAASIWVVDYYWQEPVHIEHIAPLAYELPGDYTYTHAKNDIITYETGFQNEEVIIGKIYRNKDSNTKIIVSRWEEQWHEFAPTIEYEKEVYPWALEKYQGTIPVFMGQITVFHDEIDAFGPWEDSILYKYKYFYKAYLMTNEKHNNIQYVLTVFDNDFDEARKAGESVIASMVYNEDLETEFVREFED